MEAGVFLVLGVTSYLGDICASFLLSLYPATAFSDYVHLPAALGEVSICRWLLVVGVRARDRYERSNLARSAACAGRYVLQRGMLLTNRGA